MYSLFRHGGSFKIVGVQPGSGVTHASEASIVLCDRGGVCAAEGAGSSGSGQGSGGTAPSGVQGGGAPRKILAKYRSFGAILAIQKWTKR